ncbi:uncharacterized protein LOC134249652 [Saccostrea cucullata]|uniref:uncharacterized protein LOC134249652 n=1 Tax=Saccostrea cuccullata TaxID=36930 RepID=UPI002ED03570
MKKFLEKKGRVVSVDSDGDVIVCFGTQQIKFNPECLTPSGGSPDEDEFKEEEAAQPSEDTDEKGEDVPPPQAQKEREIHDVLSSVTGRQYLGESSTTTQQCTSKELHRAPQIIHPRALLSALHLGLALPPLMNGDPKLFRCTVM